MVKIENIEEEYTFIEECSKSKHSNIKIKIYNNGKSIAITLDANGILGCVPFRATIVDGKLFTDDWWGWGT